MKKLSLLLVALTVICIASSQVPQAFSYQALVRNSSGDVVVNQNVSFEISILSGSVTGDAVYTERHTGQTNAQGIVALELGKGNIVSGSMSTIDWQSNTYYLKVAVDVTGGTNFILTGVSQILSVPYALFAEKAGNGFSGDYADLTNTPDLFDGTWYSLTGKPELFSGSYNDLTDRPVLFSGSYNDLADKPVLFSGSFTELTNTPSTLAGYGIIDGAPMNHTHNDATAITAGFMSAPDKVKLDGLSNYVHPSTHSWSMMTGTPTTLGGYGIADAMSTSHAANGITSSHITNWNTAFGWGNHATAGYLTGYTETDPVFTAHPVQGITSTNITNWNTAFGWGNHAPAGYLTGYTETDPVFLAHPAQGITSANITNWNTAFGWGNHATAGYLTAYTETDPVFLAHPAQGITSTNITNWNTAFGWGNHAGLYRPAAYVPAWSEITGNPFSISTPVNNQLLRYNGTSARWENWTPDYLTAYTETDPVWIADSSSYYMKSSLQMSGHAQVHWDNLTNRPVFFSGSYTDLTDVPAQIDEDRSDDVTVTGDQTIAGVKTFTGTIDAGNNTIINVAAPVNSTDAVNKAYLDAAIENIYNDFLNAGLNGIVRDIDGNVYKTIKIGLQVWMAENLRTSTYRNGTPIPEVDDAATWSTLTTGAYCWYNNDSATNDMLYGKLYNWYAVTDPGLLCPAGWHIPSDLEVQALRDSLGGTDVAGGMIKATGTSYWLTPNTGATNESDFTALPAGHRSSSAVYNNITMNGYWWSATQIGVNDAWNYYVSYNSAAFSRGTPNKKTGFSVRCVKD